MSYTNNEIKVGNCYIGNNHPTYIIAEIGINHNGSMEIAKQLIEESARAGVDAVKFQKRTASSIMIKENINDNPIGYLSKSIDDISTDQPKYGSWSYPDSRVELSEENFRDLQQFSKKHNVEFFASPWDEESLDFLLELNLNILKIPSVEITNYEFLEKFSKTNLPIILSTGTALMKDIDKALEILSEGDSEIMILQCTSAYPSKFEEIDLNVINTFKDKYENVIGYSGHEPGIHIPIAAVSMGARIVEKHVTLNKKMNGTDHAASIDMEELKDMVGCIREVETAFGSSEKRKFESENPLINVLGKSLVSAKDIESGSIIDKSMLTAKGPFEGIPASEYYNIIGKKIKNTKKADQILFIEDFD